MANSTAIEQQDRHFEAKAPLELGVGIDIDHGDGRDDLRTLEFRQRLQHVLTQSAALAAQDHEASG